MAEEVIAVAEKQKALWDKGSDLYKDKFEKEKSWLAVSRGVHQDWEGMAKEDQMKKLKDLKSKWKNMKDAMMRYLHTKSGDSAKKKKYVHFEALSFLLTAAEKRRTSGNYDSGVDDSSLEENCSQSSMNRDDPPSPQQSLTGASTTRSSKPTTSSQPTLPAKAGKTTTFQASLIKSLEQAAEAPNKPLAQEEDADRLYLLSLLPDYKNLSTTSKKWEFRQIVAGFFGNTYHINNDPTPTPYQQHQFSQPWNPTHPPRYPTQNTSMMQTQSSQSSPTVYSLPHSPSPFDHCDMSV